MNLPPCHSRRVLDNHSDLFYCAHPRVHATDQRVTPPMCQTCDRWGQPAPAVFRPFPPPPGLKAAGQCQHRGEQVGWRECGPCLGSVRIKVFACHHPRHVETTLVECGLCPDFQLSPLAPSEGMEQ